MLADNIEAKIATEPMYDCQLENGLAFSAALSDIGDALRDTALSLDKLRIYGTYS